MDVTMKELLVAMIDEGGSDLHIRAYMPPELRVHGELLPLAEEEFTEEEAYKGLILHIRLQAKQSKESFSFGREG